MRPAFLPALAFLFLAACQPFSRDFRITGEITLASPLVARAPRENSVLFVIAKNMGGVPVAVKRIVNPQFPVYYALTKEDLVVPGSHPGDPLTIEVEMNAHGNAGAPVKGDLAGFYPDTVSIRESRVHIVIDRIVEMNGPVRVQTGSRRWGR